MYLRIATRKTLFPLFLTLLTFFTLRGAHAQMFSVQDNDVATGPRNPGTGIYIGLEPIQFTYEGPDGTDPLFGAYEVDGLVFRARLETPGLYGYVGVGGTLTGMDTHSWFDAGVMTGWKFQALNRAGIQLVIPVQLKSSLTTVGNDANFANGFTFERGTLSAGSGGELRFDINNRIRFLGAAQAQYGFAFSTGDAAGGTVFEFGTTSRVYFDRMFGDLGISVGWDYQFKRFDVEDNIFDYNLRGNSFLVGITF